MPQFSAKPLPLFNQRKADKFWANVDIVSHEQCWNWTRGKYRLGYGIAFRRFSAHRIAWMLAHDSDPAPFHVLHKCDNPSCCNPSHLFLGTHADNMADLKDKGRLVGTRPRKLTPEKVKKMRELYAAGGVTQRDLGKIFGVDYGVCGRIVRRQKWQHVA